MTRIPGPRAARKGRSKYHLLNGGHAGCGKLPNLDPDTVMSAADVPEADRCMKIGCWGTTAGYGRSPLTSTSRPVRAAVDAILSTGSAEAAAGVVGVSKRTILTRADFILSSSSPRPWTYEPDTWVVVDADGAQVLSVAPRNREADALLVLLGVS